MLEDYCKKYLEKSDNNFKLYEHLKDNNIFIEWQAVAIFYSALCIAKAYLYSKNFPINSINSHDTIKYYLAVEQSAKQSKVLDFYNNLYRFSRDARYSTKRITQDMINKMLINYGKVKNLLIVKFEQSDELV